MNAQSDIAPSNIEAEQQLLEGSLMCDNNLIHKVTGILTQAHFYDPVHARVYAAILDRVNADRIASPVTLKTVLDHDEGLKEPGRSVSCTWQGPRSQPSPCETTRRSSWKWLGAVMCWLCAARQYRHSNRSPR
ncbi:DnaB-like helicase N-terminal domain-containing protein [Vibrio hannami]|uniref:DnaB-like helicase N-terminal domain-containing protein n=1 Tax=Vibrio hannami TaxID=2717094 RepID=UPI003BAE3C12